MPDSPPSRRRLIVLLLMALCFISHFNRISMSIAGDERIMPQYGISPQSMGQVYSAFLLVYTIFMTIGGAFIDRVGVRTALATMAIGSGIFAMLTGVVGSVVSAAATLLLALLVVRSLMGLVTTPLHPGCAQAVSVWMPETQRSLANGLVTSAALLGVAFTYPLFGKLMDALGWTRAFVIAGAATVLLGLVWWFVARASSDSSRESNIRGSELPAPHFKAAEWWSLLSNRNILLLTASYAAVGYFQYLFFYWIHYYFESVLHFGKEQSRWYSTIPILTMAVSMAVGGWFSAVMQRRYGRALGRKIVPMGGMVLSAFFLGLGLMSKKPEAIVFWFALSMGAVGACEAAFWLTAVELGGRRGGSAASIINTGGNGIGLLAPLFTPFISEWLGDWKWSISFGGLFSILGGVCWWFMQLEETAPTRVKELNQSAVES